MQQPNLHTVLEDPDLGIILADGTRLSARVWSPEGAERAPTGAVLEFLPYRKRDGTTTRDELTHPWFAERGLVCLRVDMRGNGDSEGLMEDEYSPQELSDAVEVIHWIAAQPWSNGKVGMMGISWGGFNALQVAALQPEPLKAIITLCSTVDRFADDIHYKGGCLLNENLGWGATMWAYSSRAPDPGLRENWREMWLERLAAEPFLPALWLSHQRRDAYWRHGSVCEDFSRLQAAVLAVGGWGDAYKNAAPQLVAQVPGAKGILGPWVHKYPHFAVPAPRMDFLGEAFAFWSAHLLDGAPHTAPAQRIYIMDGVRPATWYAERPGRWVADPQTETRTLHLTDQGLSDTPGPLAAHLASPADTGAEAGEYCAIWLGPEMPGDQRPDDARSLCFDSAPLPGDTEISGAPEVTLTLTPDQAQGQLAVRLCHLHPDGASTRITYGVLNLAHRAGHAAPAPMRPGEAVTVRVPLDHIGYRLPAGHRLRVAVSTAYWPLLWPGPHALTAKLGHGALALPCITDAAPHPVPDTPQMATPRAVETLRAEAHTRRRETDLLTGDVTLVIEDDFGKLRDETHGLINGTVARERWTIHPDDPLSARGSCHWTTELERGEIRLRTETRCEMWADAATFYLSAHLEAYEGDVLVFEKPFSAEIRRDHL